MNDWSMVEREYLQWMCSEAYAEWRISLAESGKDREADFDLELEEEKEWERVQEKQQLQLSRQHTGVTGDRNGKS